MVDELDEYFNSVRISFWERKGITKEELERHNDARKNYLYFKEQYEIAKSYYDGICRGLDFKYNPMEVSK